MALHGQGAALQEDPYVCITMHAAAAPAIQTQSRSVGVVAAGIGLGSYLSGALHEPSIGHGGRTVLALTDTVCRLQTRLLYSEWTLCYASPGPICSKTLCSSHTMQHCMRF